MLQTVSRKLAESGIGALVVLNEAGGLAGIISESDVVRALSTHGLSLFALKAGDIMTSKVYVCTPHESELRVMTWMTEKQIRHMPVMDGDRVVGMVTLSDAVKQRLVRIRELAADVGRTADPEKRLGIFTRHLKSRPGSQRSF